MNQVMECLNIDKDKINKKKKLANKPESLKTANMPQIELQLSKRSNTEHDGFAVPTSTKQGNQMQK